HAAADAVRGDRWPALRAQESGRRSARGAGAHHPVFPSQQYQRDPMMPKVIRRAGRQHGALRRRAAAETVGGEMTARRNLGFTLIELVITVAIVALLASAAMPVSELVVQRAKETELRRSLYQI